jgi:protein SPT2
MTSTFATLMAISASNTQASQRAAQQALAEKKRKEEEELRKRAEREKKEKELEARMRLKHFEDEKRERERKEREEKLHEEKERLREKKEAMARDKLLGNVKKASRSRSPSYPTVNSSSRDDLRKKRLPSDEEDEDASFLTREEKRERKRVADLSFGASRSKRVTVGSGSSQRSIRVLPGGAVDSSNGDLSQNSASSSSQSIKARLAAMPNTLQRLNVNKRDTRTIDEIVRDRERSKEGRVLNGEQAKGFNDWFGKKKDTTGLANKTAALDLSANDSRSGTPTSSIKPVSSSALNKKPSTTNLPSLNKSKDPLKPSPPKTTSRPGPSPRPSGTGASKPRPSSAHIPPSAGKKHRRSESFSEDEEEYDSPPSKKRYAPTAQDDYRSEIWKLFGKDRSIYVNDMVDSDEDDMEADAMDLEMEEMRRFVVSRCLGIRPMLIVLCVVSARLARKEDEQALREEKMHEHEKRKRKMERERR